MMIQKQILSLIENILLYMQQSLMLMAIGIYFKFGVSFKYQCMYVCTLCTAHFCVLVLHMRIGHYMQNLN